MSLEEYDFDDVSFDNERVARAPPFVHGTFSSAGSSPESPSFGTPRSVAVSQTAREVEVAIKGSPVELLLVSSNQDYCAGVIKGSSPVRWCTKSRAKCMVASHAQKVILQRHHYYIRCPKNDYA
jgi:hypothetical protein